MNALASLRAFERSWRAVAPAGERCQLCAGAIDQERHAHVIDLEQRTLACACARCAGSFADPTSRRFRTVPDRVLRDAEDTLDESRWAALRIPVRLAFIFVNSRLGQWVALYPGPAGAIESVLDDAAAGALAAATPLAAIARPDVEAVLVRGSGPGPGAASPSFEVFLAPIDACYQLVGRIRTHWQGFHGGARAWQEIGAFFDELRARATGATGS